MPQHKPIPSLILVFLLCFCYSLAQGQVQQIGAELQRLPTIKDSVNLVNSLNRLGALYRNRNADSSFYYGMKAKQLATSLHDEHGQIAADHVIAYAFFKRGLYPEALELLGKVLPYYQKADDTEKVIRIYLDMADVLNKGIDKPKGISLLHDAIQMGRNLKKDSVLSEVYMVYYIRNPNLPKDSIDYYLSKSKAIASRYKDEYMLNYNLMLQASRLVSNGQREEALPLIEQLKLAAQRMGNANIVAHDLRNPIGGMFSIASMMLADARHTAEDKEYLELIKTSGKLSLDLVSDLLLVHAKTDELKKEAVNLGHLLHNCVNLLRHKALLKDQQIALEANDVVRILANQEKLWRVVSNLIGNAIKFSPRGATIGVSLQKTANHVLIAVKDDGIGIPEEIAGSLIW